MPVIIGSGSNLPAQLIVLAPSGDTSGGTDQNNITAAIATLLANGDSGGTIALGAGDFYWNSAQINLYTSSSRLKIVGQGQATRVHNTSTGTPDHTKSTFYAYGGADVLPYPGPIGTHWLEISNMELVGSATAGGGIYLNGIYQGILSGIYAHGFTATGANAQFGSGIILDSAIEILVLNPVILNCTNAMYLGGSANINNIIGGWLQNDTNGVILAGGNDNNFYGTVFQQISTNSVLVAGGVTATHLDYCWFEAGGNLSIAGEGTVINRPTVAGAFNPYLYATASDTKIVGPPPTNVTLTITAGATNTIIEDPPEGFDYRASVSDGSYGTELAIRRATPIINSVAASGAAQTIPNLLAADVSVITLTANCALTFPPPTKARTVKVNLIQDGTGSRTVTWPASVVWPAGTAPTLTTTPGHEDRLEFTSDLGINWYGHIAVANAATTPAPVPLAQGNVAAWYDASQIQAPDNTTLASWPDLSLNGRPLLQSSVANPVGYFQPQFYKTTLAKLVNGLPAVWFTPGSGTFMASTVNGTVNQPTTIYVVCYPTVNTGTPFVIDGSPRQAILMNAGTWSESAGTQVNGAGAATINTPHVLTAVFNGASSLLRDNGVQVVSGNAGANAFSQLTVGSQQGGAANWFTGAVCEIIVYSAAHSGATLTAVESYLTTKWG